MTQQLTLSVLDQSPIREGGTAADALKESVELARIVERLGYARYWVAEHHNTGSFAGTSPEILIGQIAAATSTLRVGSAGVMLTHYSAFKVAEQFRILDAFFPGRIDLGIGRAPGSDQRTADALSYPRPQVDVQEFPRQVVDLLGYLDDVVDPSHPFAQLRAQAGPLAETRPEVWLLGSTDYSARVAAALGLPFAFADFFGYTGTIGPAVAGLYRREFRPTRFGNEPKVNVTIHVICAPTTREAEFLASSRKLLRAAHVTGQSHGLLPPEQAIGVQLTDEVRRYVEESSRGAIDGDPPLVRERILRIARDYRTDDIGIVTNCYAFADRVRSYQLVAEAFGLTPRA